MAAADDALTDAWGSILTTLESDERITPQLYGFLSLVEPKGIMAGTFYLEVPNEFTRGMIEQRSRVPLLNAIGGLEESLAVSTFAISGRTR
jgi:chromosomal replication initiator protein